MGRQPSERGRAPEDIVTGLRSHHDVVFGQPLRGESRFVLAFRAHHQVDFASVQHRLERVDLQ
jgi:hypothetical protein